MHKKVLPIALLSSFAFLSSCTGSRDAPVSDIPVVKTLKKTSHISGAVVTTPATHSTLTGINNNSGASLMSPEKPEATSNPAPITRQVSYQTPDGLATVTFTIEVKDSTIASASSSVEARDRESREWQGKFARNVSQVVGKKMSDIASLDAIGGASLTTEAFKQFVKNL